MNPDSPQLESFEKLAAMARDDKGPTIDVTSKVMARVKELTPLNDFMLEHKRPHKRMSPLVDATLLIFCVCSMLLAIGTWMYSFEGLWLLNDPLAGLFEPIRHSMR